MKTKMKKKLKEEKIKSKKNTKQHTVVAPIEKVEVKMLLPQYCGKSMITHRGTLNIPKDGVMKLSSKFANQLVATQQWALVSELNKKKKMLKDLKKKKVKSEKINKNNDNTEVKEVSFNTDKLERVLKNYDTEMLKEIAEQSDVKKEDINRFANNGDRNILISKIIKSIPDDIAIGLLA